MDYAFLTSPAALLLCLASLPLLVGASIAGLPNSPIQRALWPLRIAASLAVLLAIVLIAARFVVVSA
ncbi:hypothetical protein ACQ3I4_12365 [Zafaria sp. Z1313]|uniref:hypothetical protein n=1 Tax=unclassified Zafaria TaxID=2828765 RepID=UPI002E78BD34|nr:hypothetical protein [Zafaria sp. J156]MEE1620478.1 hypothetical protein [Zafaria sp. J156]